MEPGQGIDEGEFGWHAGRYIWDAMYLKKQPTKEDILQVPVAEESVSMDLTKADEQGRPLGQHQLAYRGRGMERTWKHTVLAPRKPNAERCYFKEANDLARLRALVLQLVKARRQRHQNRAVEAQIVERVWPYIPVALRELGESKHREAATAANALGELYGEAEGLGEVLAVRLAVAGVSPEAVVERAVQRAGRRGTINF